MPSTLTARKVETIHTTGDRIELRDNRVKGLSLRVTPASAKTWCVTYRRKGDGQKQRITIGPYPEYSLENARTDAQQILAEVARGNDPALKRRNLQKSITFQTLVDLYSEKFSRFNKSQIVQRDDMLKLKKDVLPSLGRKRIEDMDKAHVVEIVDKIMARGSGVTANRTLALIKAIFNWALSEELVQTNPAARIRRRYREYPRDRVLTDQELQYTWHELERAAISKPLVIALQLAIVTGQRIGTIVGMELPELDLNRIAPTWTVPSMRTKNRELCQVPLTNFAVRLIKRAITLSNDGLYVFPSPKGGGPMHSKAATRAITRCRPNFLIPHFTTHDFRRTCASGMARLGVTPYVISLVLDHTSATQNTITNAVYVKYCFDKEKRAALQAWSDHLQKVLAVPKKSNVPSLALTSEHQDHFSIL